MARLKSNLVMALMAVLVWGSLILATVGAFPFDARAAQREADNQPVVRSGGERDVGAFGVPSRGGQKSNGLQEVIRVQDLMRTALAAAQNDYSDALWRARKYVPNVAWEVFLSEAWGSYAIPGKTGTLGGSGVVITNGEVLEWIPAQHRMRDVMAEMQDAEWILVRETPGTNSQIVGRYAYVCLDSSGGMDANWVARHDEVANRDTRALTNRSHHSIQEVPMGLLPEVVDATSFKAYRKGWKGFDNLPMLTKLTDGVCVDGSANSSSNARWRTERLENRGMGLASYLVSDLVPYSLTAYHGGRYMWGTGQWEKPNYMDPATGAGWEAVLEPLQRQGWNQEDIQKQLTDYISSSRIPQGVDYPSIKAVPMFNEIWVKLDKFKRSDVLMSMGDSSTYTYTAKVTVGIETWFPFPSQDNDGGSYTLKAPTLSMQSSVGSGQLLLPVRLQTTDGPVNVTQVGDPSPSPATATITATYGKPQIHSFSYEVTLQPTKAVKDSNASLQWGARGFVWQVTGDIDLLYGGTAVDRLPKNIKGWGNAQPISDDGNGQAGPFSMEVTDPRLNHLANEWQLSDSDAGTPGEINCVTKGVPDFQKEGPWMYCRNGKMESLAEFGYFSTGKPWQTLDLCTDEGREFLALGTLNKGIKDALDKAGGYYTNTTININSRRTNVLASAFYDLSYMPTPNTQGSLVEGENAFTEEQARVIAGRIQAETAEKPYQSGQDWANSTLMKDGGYLNAHGLTRTERESVLRNTDGLFSVGDNLFTVVVVAQSVQEGAENVGTWDDGDQITGERRGVALVWRDPFRVGNNQQNEMMVRVFRSLDASGGSDQTGFTTNTPVAVPFEWLEEYPESLEAHGGDHEAFAADMAENGRPVWECYVADLDPTDAASELRVGLERDEEGNWAPRIVSGESMERRYVFEGAEWMPTGNDEEDPGWGEAGEGSRFFRARVEVERQE